MSILAEFMKRYLEYMGAHKDPLHRFLLQHLNPDAETLGQLFCKVHASDRVTKHIYHTVSNPNTNHNRYFYN